MKKVLVLFLSILISVPALAGPRNYRGHGGRYYNPPRKPVVVHNHGPSWVGPALILGALTTAVIVANQDRPRETVIIREPTPVIYQKTIFEKITGGESWSLQLAQKKWTTACHQWQNELNNRFISDYNTTCGAMTCINGKNNYCYSTGHSTVSYR